VFLGMLSSRFRKEDSSVVVGVVRGRSDVKRES
jgi:hypothetical protein